MVGHSRNGRLSAFDPGVLSPGWVAAPEPPTIASRLDEAAAAMNPLGSVRAILLLAGGVTASLILPLTVCLAWVAGGLASEVWAWAATKSQARGEPVDQRARIVFVASYVVMNLWWWLLSALLWRSGGAAGEASAAAIALAVIAVFILLFHNVPLAFLLAGAAPSAAALTLIALADKHSWPQLTPVWMSLGLGFIFSAGRALDTPSVQETTRRLRSSLDAFHIMADNVTDVITRVDLRGVYQYLSPSSASVLGYSPDELVGTRQSAHLDEEAVEAVRLMYHRMRLDPLRSETIIGRFRHKDGHWIWLQTSVKMVCDNGLPIGAIGVMRDITNQKTIEATLEAARAEAEAANRAKGEFLANVSHEIRTPMNAILGALQLLDRESISAEGRELIRQANDCGWILSQLLNDVLDFSKIEAGQLDLTSEPMDVGEALESVAALLDSQARAKGLDLSCETYGDDLWIDADPVRLRQVLFNLVGNAVKFTVSGHVTARLFVEPASESGRRVRLEVEDTGIGMSPDVQSHLFERFRQADGDTTRRFGGTGLGLSITRALVQRMGGEIGCRSLEGVGSTFWLTFEAPAAKPLTVEAVDQGLLHGVNILLVEDNPNNRLVARTMLTRLGASVEEAEDGVIGLHAARRGAHDLILMDIQMPHMDGVTATKAIRGLRGPAARVPILGLTANVMVHQKAEYLAAGMNGVVAKPISPAALLGEIGRLMNSDEASVAELAAAP